MGSWFLPGKGAAGAERSECVAIAEFGAGRCGRQMGLPVPADERSRVMPQPSYRRGGERHLERSSNESNADLDHVVDPIYLPVTDIDRSMDFYQALLTPLGLAHRWDFKAQAGWPDLDGFGAEEPGFWLKKSSTTLRELYVAFTAPTEEASRKRMTRR